MAFKSLILKVLDSAFVYILISQIMAVPVHTS